MWMAAAVAAVVASAAAASPGAAAHYESDAAAAAAEALVALQAQSLTAGTSSSPRTRCKQQLNTQTTVTHYTQQKALQTANNSHRTQQPACQRQGQHTRDTPPTSFFPLQCSTAPPAPARETASAAAMRLLPCHVSHTSARLSVIQLHGHMSHDCSESRAGRES